jgi:hypothetical protein
MNKNIIKQYLNKTFLSEATEPAIKLAKKIKKDDEKINSDGVEEIGDDMKDYEKNSVKPDVNQKTMGENKFTYDNSEEEYHNEMEIMNGQEMIQYDRAPNKTYSDRALEAIEGSSRMGNNPEWANVVAKGQGGDPEFGKNLVKKIKSSIKKRDEQTPTIHLQGRDIEADRKDYGNKPYAFENTNKQTPQIKETMKRLRFKKDFNGVGNALKMIPETYKTDKKVFEMTDGNESYKIRWEGTLTEGKAVILTASDKRMVSEDVQKMKHLMGYSSEKTLGTVKGNARIDENKAFTDMYSKFKKFLAETEDIEGQDAEKEAPFEEADVNQAPEAKKHVDGSVSTEKGTQAPKPKSGEWEKISVPHAADAKKHIQGSVSTDKGTQAPKPKTGDLDKVKSQAPEAKAEIKGSVKEGTKKKA